MFTTRWRIPHQLALLVLLASLTIAAILAASAWQMGRSDAALLHLTEVQRERMEIAMRWRQAIAENGARMAAIAKSDDESLAPFFRDTMAAVTARVTRDLARYREVDESAEGRAAVNRLLDIRKDYLSQRDRLLELKRQGQTEAAAALLSQEFMPMLTRYNEAADALVLLQEQRGEALATSMREQSRRLMLTLAAMGMVALALLLLLCVASVKSLKRALRHAVVETQQLAEGDLRSADGRRSLSGPPETREVLEALARMRQSWSALVGRLQQTAEGLTVASDQIAAGNMDLSQRTEHAASGLQQGSALLAALSEAMRSSAQVADGALTQAQSSAAMAAQAQLVVTEVVEALRSAGEDSNKVRQVTEVIDALAFQTNILALNAAVEAARAGDHGRGFAVVAAEVRALAQRTAASAKEVRGIIERSAQSMNQGHALAGRAGAAMAEVDSTVQGLGLEVARLADDARKQSDEVVRVALAIEELDSLTQQNAALVEQSAAAAESLRQQASGLVQEAQAFRVA